VLGEGRENDAIDRLEDWRHSGCVQRAWAHHMWLYLHAQASCVWPSYLLVPVFLEA
jgi:hypothetical protein